MPEYRATITVAAAAPKNLEAWEELLTALEARSADYGPVLNVWAGHSVEATVTLACEAESSEGAAAECVAVLIDAIDSLRWPWRDFTLEDVEEVVEETV